MAAFGALLGFGVLSKGLVALLVAAAATVPVLVRRPRALLDLLRPSAAGGVLPGLPALVRGLLLGRTGSSS